VPGARQCRLADGRDQRVSVWVYVVGDIDLLGNWYNQLLS